MLVLLTDIVIEQEEEGGKIVLCILEFGELAKVEVNLPISSDPGYIAHSYP